MINILTTPRDTSTTSITIHLPLDRSLLILGTPSTITDNLTTLYRYFHTTTHHPQTHLNPRAIQHILHTLQTKIQALHPTRSIYYPPAFTETLTLYGTYTGTLTDLYTAVTLLETISLTPHHRDYEAELDLTDIIQRHTKK